MTAATPRRTEGVPDSSKGLDQWPGDRLARHLWQGQMDAVASLEAALPAIAAAADAAAARLTESDNGRLVYAGAGTSGRLAVQDGVELVPTFRWPAKRLLFLLAGGDAAFTRSVENAEDDSAAAVRLLDEASIGRDDVVVGVAASGSTPFAVAAVEHGSACGALAIGIANNPKAPLLQKSAHAILLDSGPEAIGGSTRMKAGTAQRACLTILSTMIMVRLNRVHDGYMVDLVATNRKLRQRSVDIVCRLTDATADEARVHLSACDGSVKTAIVSIVKHMPPQAAREALDRHHGSLRLALGESTATP